MKGQVEKQPQMFHTFILEELIPSDHPLRAIKKRVDAELARMRPQCKAAYATTGRPSIPPEQLIKATLLQALYTIRSERQLCEQIRYNMLYRWFVDLAPDQKVWDHSTFTQNRDRFAAHDLMGRFFRGSVAQAIGEEAVSIEHFSVDGTLIESWASMKSFRPRDEDDHGEPPAGGGSDSNRWVDWHGERRTNATHASKTDPEARLARKGNGQEACLAHSMHVFMENRAGLIMDIELGRADGYAEREAARHMIKRAKRRGKLAPKTLGADKGYGDGAFLEEIENAFEMEPHIPPRQVPCVISDIATLARFIAHMRRHEKGYKMSQRCRMRIEEIFGWLKTVGGMRRARFVGRWKIRDYAYIAAAAWNLMRLVKLAEA